MTAQTVAAFCGVVVAGFAFGFGLLQYARAQRWQRRQLVAEKINEFEADPRVQSAMAMLDWNARPVELFPECAGPDRFATVTDTILASALRCTDLHGFSDVDRRIRDTFDAFFTGMDRLYVFIDAGLVTAEEFDPYVRYWIKILADSRNDRKTHRFRTGVLWPYIDCYGYDGVQALCRAYGYDIRPPLHVIPGDIVFTKGTARVSRLIRLFSTHIGEKRTQVNHVGIIVAPGTASADMVEALAMVRRDKLDHYADRSTLVGIYRDVTLTDEQRATVAAKAEEYVGRHYGYLKIIAHLLDWFLLGAYVFRRLTSSDRYPICSWVVASAYASINESFGCTVGQASPDDIWEYIDALAHRSQFTCIHKLSLLNTNTEHRAPAGALSLTPRPV